METKIEKSLRSLRRINPSDEFAKNSLSLITAHIQKPSRSEYVRQLFWRELKLGIVFAGTAAVILAVFIIGSFFGTGSLAERHYLNNKNLLQEEAQSLEFEIEIAEAQYFKQSADEISVALRKISEEPTAARTR